MKFKSAQQIFKKSSNIQFREKLSSGITTKTVQSKHNNVFNNVKFATYLEFYTANVNNMLFHPLSTEHVMCMYWNVCL